MKSSASLSIRRPVIPGCTCNDKKLRQSDVIAPAFLISSICSLLLRVMIFVSLSFISEPLVFLSWQPFTTFDLVKLCHCFRQVWKLFDLNVWDLQKLWTIFLNLFRKLVFLAQINLLHARTRT